MEKSVSAKIKNINILLEYINNSIKKYKVPNKRLDKIILLCEEVIVNLINHSSGNSNITVSEPVKKFGVLKFDIKMQGDEFDFAQTFVESSSNVSFDESLYGDDSENYIRNIIFNSYKDNLNYKYKNGSHIAQIKIPLSQNLTLKRTLCALVIAIIFGSLCSLFVPGHINNAMLDFVLSPISKIYLNALKLIVVPVVFFSLSSCIASCGNLKEFGKIGFRLILIYLITALISMFVGGGFSVISGFGDSNLVNAITSNSQELIDASSSSELSLLDTIIGIVPDNIFKPFFNSDMLALIFLSIIIGIGLDKIRDKNKILIDVFESCNKLFITITNMIIKLIPIIVFCMFTIICITLDAQTIMSLLGWLILLAISCFTMVIFYILYVPIRLRLSNIPFVKKMFDLCITTITLCSSSACMPVTMDTCKKLGIASKVYSFSIPLGATINMNGSAIYYVVTGIFMCNVFGIQLEPNMIFSMCVTILLLSVATPGVSGSNLVGMLIVFSQIGIPAEAIGLVIGLNPIADALATLCNVYGDVASSLIVSKDLKLFDKKEYYA